MNILSIATVLLILSLSGQPATADSVGHSGPVPVPEGYEVFLNVTNDGTIGIPITDFHVTIEGQGVIIPLESFSSINSPPGWIAELLSHTNLQWITTIGNGIKNKDTQEGFSIITNTIPYKLTWQTTHNDKFLPDGEGNFTVS